MFPPDRSMMFVILVEVQHLGYPLAGCHAITELLVIRNSHDKIVGDRTVL